VRLASSNGEVKRLVVNGEVTFGLADTDDAFEALRAKAPVAVVYPDQDDSGTLFMPTAVLLLRRGPNPEAGKKLIDHLLTSRTEAMLLKSGGYLPLRSDVENPAAIPRSGQVKKIPADYSQIAVTMERIQPYLRQWVGL
jgi:iron(III) transport system substrate-binding protein